MAVKKKNQSSFLLRLKAFFSHWIVKNLLIAIGIVVALILAIHLFLSGYTRHGEKKAAPDFVGMRLADARRLAEECDMELVILDSVYHRGAVPGTVYSQIPAAHKSDRPSYVKRGRHFSIVINAFVPRKVKMPNLVDLSLRQAMTNLESLGLELGRLIYKNTGEGTNLVLGQRYRGSKIVPGRVIEAGAVIDLEVGQTGDDRNTVVPDVTGREYRDAVRVLHDNSLNVRTRFDSSVRTFNDSLKAVVYRQSPEASRVPTLRGKEVTVYLRPAEPEEAE